MNGPTNAPGGPTAATLPEDKLFTTLKARAALAGLQLFRSHPDDGPPRLLLEHRGGVRQVGLDELEAVVVASAWSRP